MNKPNTKNLVQLSMLIAIMIVLDLTGIGLIRIPPVALTIMHVPVIIGAILMGPMYGGILGGAFGLISMLEATFRPGSPVDMLFSPFTTDNVLATLFMCYVPRILIGVIAGWLFLLLKRVDKSRLAAIAVAAAVSAICHTTLVLGSLWLFFEALPFKEIFGTIVGINGLLELGLAIVLSVAICKPLLKVLKR